MYLEMIKKLILSRCEYRSSQKESHLGTYLMASSDLKFKNTALMLNASIFIRKELVLLCGRNIGINNISTYKYSNLKPDMDKISIHVKCNRKNFVDKT